MIISAILVVCRAEHLAQVRAEIASRPGLEVHHSDSSGRIVVTLDAESPDESMAKLREVQGLAHVVLAEMMKTVVEEA